jgi:hypothetical protein
MYSEMIPDTDVKFSVAVDGNRSEEHQAARQQLLTTMKRSVAEAIPVDALAWVRAIEDILLEEIEGLQDALHTAHSKNEIEK